MNGLAKTLINATIDAVALPVYMAAAAVTGEDNTKPIINRLSKSMDDIVKYRNEMEENAAAKRKEDILKKAAEYDNAGEDKTQEEP